MTTVANDKRLLCTYKWMPAVYLLSDILFTFRPTFLSLFTECSRGMRTFTAKKRSFSAFCLPGSEAIESPLNLEIQVIHELKRKGPTGQYLCQAGGGLTSG